MANKQIIFLNRVKTPYGDVLKGEILTGIETTSQTSNTPGFIFNFYEKKDPKKFLDKSVEETFFIPKTAFGDKGTIREVKPSDLKNSKGQVININVNTPKNSEINTSNNSNKMISFVIGALSGVIIGYIVLNKIVK
jgi:hypothetical protein